MSPGQPDLFDLSSGALFSDCRQYRYVLWRLWDNRKPRLMFVGLNPSTADEYSDDRTIGRCRDFARDLGYGGIYMVNLFAYRATKPRDMLNHPAPIGPENDQYLVEYTNKAGMVICAWGGDGGHLGRDREVVALLGAHPLYCLGTTQGGEPRHPLYLAANTVPELYPGPGSGTD